MESATTIRTIEEGLEEEEYKNSMEHQTTIDYFNIEDIYTQSI